jgi:hypothetical protein
MYGVLKSTTNTGLDSELQYIFSTPLSIVSNQPAYISDTLSLKRKTNSQKVQRWEISAEIVPTNDSPNFLVHSVTKGFTEVFYLRMPQVYSPTKISQSLNLILTNTALAGATTINITNALNVNLTGQFINFSGTSKVYLITSNGDDLGNNLTISPPLLTNISSTTAIISGDKVTMYARYDENTQLGITYIDGVLASQGAINFIEAL